MPLKSRDPWSCPGYWMASVQGCAYMGQGILSWLLEIWPHSTVSLCLCFLSSPLQLWCPLGQSSKSSIVGPMPLSRPSFCCNSEISVLLCFSVTPLLSPPLGSQGPKWHTLIFGDITDWSDWSYISSATNCHECQAQSLTLAILYPFFRGQSYI